MNRLELFLYDAASGCFNRVSSSPRKNRPREGRRPLARVDREIRRSMKRRGTNARNICVHDEIFEGGENVATRGGS